MDDRVPGQVDGTAAGQALEDPRLFGTRARGLEQEVVVQTAVGPQLLELFSAEAPEEKLLPETLPGRSCRKLFGGCR